MQTTEPSLPGSQTKKNLIPSTAQWQPRQAIKLFHQKEPLVFTPTHRLAKEMGARGAKVQTYHSFFCWSGQTEWTPERMGQKYILRMIIWDEVYTVPRPILETFLEWLDSGGVQVVCCGDQGQSPPIVGGMSHDWLLKNWP
ncbi:MAG: AAA family ATPase [Candidatus Thiodiazotropha sp.]